jgi:type IV pilus assembly protein PilW
MRSGRSSRHQQGVSLIELLISVAIGLVVIAAVVVSYVGSGQAGRYQAALTQMNQDAQAGLNIIARDIQQAGYSAPTALFNANASNPLLTTTNWVATFSLGTATAVIFGCDGTKGAVPFTDPAAAGQPTCAASVAPTTSAIEVVYEADTKNTVFVPNGPGTADDVPADCRGSALVNSAGAGAVPVYIARNRYFIDTGTGANASGRPELYCASNVSAKQPLLENVDDMQIWYGIQVAANPRQVVRYVKAGKDATTANTLNAQGLPEWANVISVRICLLMRSEEPIIVADDVSMTKYLDCDSNTQTSIDRYLRRAYFTTATVRARMAY